MNLAQEFPHVEQVVTDMAAQGSATLERREALQRAAECMGSRLMTRGDIVQLDDWLSRLSPDEMSCLTEGDPDDALDLMLDSPEMWSGDCVGEVLADIAMVV